MNHTISEIVDKIATSSKPSINNFEKQLTQLMTKIPFALDPHGNEVHIEDAISGKREYYQCIDCKGHLQARKGPEREHYFAHYPGVLDERNCSLGTPEAIRKLTEEKRTTNRERAHNQHQIEVAVRIRYGTIAELEGILPVLRWDDLKEDTNPDTLLDSLSLKGKNIAGTFSLQEFHPNHTDATIQLDTDKDEYIIRIGTNDHPELSRLEGEWRADGVEPGDVFIGDETQAIRINGQPKAAEGDWIGIVKSEDPNDNRNGVDVYELGNNYLIGFHYHEHEDIFSDYFGSSAIQHEQFAADLVLPDRATPNTETPQLVMPGEEVLIGITPAPDTDPKFELVPVPREAGTVEQLDALGEGVVRFWSDSFPGLDPIQLTVHRPNTDEHRLFQFEPTDDVEYPTWEHDSRVTLTVGTTGEPSVLDSVAGPTKLTVPSPSSIETFVESVEMTCPKGYRFDFKAEFGSEDGQQIVRRQEQTLPTVAGLLEDVIDEGCTRIQFKLDGVHDLTIEFESEPEVPDPESRPDPDDPEPMYRQKLPDKVVKDRLHDMNPLPEKARWKVVREVYNIPKGTPHRETPGGTKKQVRHALQEVQDEQEEEPSE
ncbi:hypothetical protein V5735_13050 (plasmid) [Haladaptatus sp. SPP-AMP-3]|uniref:hypothetical protein n=1 Tax=Haladaptatus sp. SPP-AMP-3 TaxID=3121295 RepID=UPI003C2BB1A1